LRSHLTGSKEDMPGLQVVRGGKEQLVSNQDVVVGDVVVLDTGDKVIADGYIIQVRNTYRCTQLSRCRRLTTTASALLTV
jgi:magnesium-transporting ATPase (P-type)